MPARTLTSDVKQHVLNAAEPVTSKTYIEKYIQTLLVNLDRINSKHLQFKVCIENWKGGGGGEMQIFKNLQYSTATSMHCWLKLQLEWQ